MQQRDSIPEMDITALIKMMRACFQIVTEPVDGKPYAIRFMGSPYNPFCEETRSIQVFGHNRGSKMSPHNIKAVLAKFEITEATFLESLAAFESDIFMPDGSSAAIPAKESKPN